MAIRQREHIRSSERRSAWRGGAIATGACALLRPLLILLALIFLFEAWLWEQLEPIVALDRRVIPLARIKAAVARWIRALPPSATLLVFLIPVVLLLPFKLLGLWLLATASARRQRARAAKVVTLGITAFIFDLTRDKLLQLAWFRWLYDACSPGSPGRTRWSIRSSAASGLLRAIRAQACSAHAAAAARIRRRMHAHRALPHASYRAMPRRQCLPRLNEGARTNAAASCGTSGANSARSP